MTRHFLYFIVCSTRNRLRRQLRRLRTPRYALAVLAGAAYFWLIFGRSGGAAADEAMGAAYIGLARSVGPLLLAVLAAWWWLWGGHRTGLVLSPAETHLLVPAPISRAVTVRFKIMQAQIPILFSSLLGVFVTRGSVLPWPLRLASLWALLATLHMHQVAASLVHAAADEHGRSGIRRNAVPLALFGGAVLTMLVALAAAVGDIRAAPGLESAAARLGELVREPGPRIVLAPFRLLLAPLTAPTAWAWLPAFGVTLLVLLAHYVWVQRTDAAFEEGAAEQGVRRANRVAALRSGDVARARLARVRAGRKLAQPLLPLRGTLPPAWALLWKNVLYTQRTLRPAALIVVLVAAVGLLSPTLFASDSPAQALRRVGIVLAGLAGLVTVIGPLAFRNDLRMDLRHIDALRTWPLSGRDIVTAEIAASALVIAALQLPLAFAGITALMLAGALSPGTAAAAALLAAIVLPSVDALGVTIQNAIALLYPGWARIGEVDSGGMETVGHNLLTLVGTVLLLFVTSIPPLLAGLAVGAPLMFASPVLAFPLAALAAAAAVAAEVLLLVRWLGRIYDATDPVAAGLLR